MAKPRMTTAEKLQKLWIPRAVPMQFDWVPVTRENRTRTRLDASPISVHYSDGDKYWTVTGNLELGDRYGSYKVRLLDDGYVCSCEEHAHGQTRGFCTHAFAVVLAEYGDERALYPKCGKPEEFPDYKFQDEVAGVMAALNCNQFVAENFVKLGDENARNGGSHDDFIDRVRVAGILPEVFADERKEVTQEVTQQQQQQPFNPWSLPWLINPQLKFKTVCADPFCDGEDSFHGQLCERCKSKIPPKTPEEVEIEVALNEDSWVDPKLQPSREKSLLKLVPLDPMNIAPVSRWDAPEKFQMMRPHQYRGLCSAVEVFRDGKKFCFIDAPTGSGKTLLGVALFQELAGFTQGQYKGKGFYVCTDKELQLQAYEDFKSRSWFEMIMGRVNYPTRNFPERHTVDLNAAEWATFLSCSDCQFSAKKNCRYCNPPGWESQERGGYKCLGRCPYQQQKRKCVAVNLIDANTSYLLRVCNSFAWKDYDDRTILIIDEADKFESELMSYVTVEVKEKMLEDLEFVFSGLGRPELKTVQSSWLAWAMNCIAAVGRIILRRKEQMLVHNPEPLALSELDRFKKPEVDLPRDLKKWEALAGQLQLFIASIEEGDTWVYDGYIEKDQSLSAVDNSPTIGPVVFKPVKIDKFAKQLVLDKFDRVAFMSATLISSQQMAIDLGIDLGEMGEVVIPSTFPVANRPVYVIPVADNSFKKQAESFPIIIDAMQRILIENHQHRVLIHSVSYQQTTKIAAELRRRFPGRDIITHEKGMKEKQAALKRYRESPSAVIVSPSMARGSDLRDDDCRVQIIPKCPYGNLGDKQTAARLYGTHDGRTWYAVNTIREIVQMTGRGVRSETDWAKTYILDKSFTRLWNENQNLFPKYWRESVSFVAV